ncbi:unnamed protein product, partial [Brachionus calyciflorus]
LLDDSFNNRLIWSLPPKNILVVKRLGESAREPFIDILKFLIEESGDLNIFIEDTEYTSEYLTNYVHSKIKIFQKNTENFIDLIISLGGDGTLLHISSIFKNKCPPILSIHYGSLGFLCPFDFENFKSHIKQALKVGGSLIKRDRLECNLCGSDDSFRIDCKSKGSSEFTALNEVVINRGSNSDGLIVSTSTGSTAYALSAGVSLCHPSLELITISAICPHSLSFRPIILPIDVEIKISLNVESRGNAFFSVDGHSQTELKHSQYLLIRKSKYCFATLSRSDQFGDWFESLNTCLNWNDRKKQHPLTAEFSKSNPKTASMKKTSTLNDINSCFLSVLNFDQGYISQKSDDSDYFT